MKRTLAAWTMTLALPLSAAASELSLEAAKNESGLRFNEGSMSAQVGQKGAVYAGDAKSVFKDVQQAAKKSPSLKVESSSADVSAAAKPAPRLSKKPAAERDSIGSVLVRCAGGLAGLAATVAITAAAPIALGMAAVAGATAKAWPSFQSGKPALQIIKEGLIGAATGCVSLVLIGDAVGDAIGKGLEKLFKKG
jgi:hypothetical protein